MRKRAPEPLPRGFGLAIAGLILISAPVLAAVPDAPATGLRAWVFSEAELTIPQNTVRFPEVASELGNRAAWDEFFARHGEDFEVFLDRRSGVPSNVIGPVPLVPGSGIRNQVSLDDVGRRLGRAVADVDAGVVAEVVVAFLAESRAALAIDSGELGEARATEVRDGLWHVSIPRRVDGIPVRHSRVAATLNRGNLVLLGAEVWGPVRASTRPRLGAEEALAAGFDFVGGELPFDQVRRQPALELVPTTPPGQPGTFLGPVGQGYRHRLVWVFTFERSDEIGLWEVMVDAHSGKVVSFQDVQHYADRSIVGGIYPLTSTDVCPTDAHGLVDKDRCGEMQSGYPMPWTDTGVLSDPFTDGAGVYDWPGGTATTTLSGLFVNVTDGCGVISESSGTGDIDMGGANGDHACAVPPAASPGDTASARTVFNDMNKIAEIARGWLPTNPWLTTGTVPVSVNISPFCNGFYSPGSGMISLFRPSAPGCRSSGEILTFLDHEWGHAMDDNDSGGLLSNSSEGYADIAAMFRSETSCIFYGFFWTWDRGCGMTSDGTGFNGNEGQTAAHCITECSGDRDADWAKHVDGLPDTALSFVCPLCGGGGGPCGRQTHCAAAPQRQAAWDLAARDLQSSPFYYDTNLAFILASKLFYQGSGLVNLWYECDCGAGTSAGCGAASGYMQWLAADDDDGNVLNGTPHMTAIFDAFDRHGIACSTPAPFNTGCAGAPSGRPDVSLTAGGDTVALSWAAVPGASEYWVLRSEGVFGCHTGKALTATVAGTSYVDGETLPGHQYCYSVIPASSPTCFGRASSCSCTTPFTCTDVPTVTTLLSESFNFGIPASWSVVDGGSGGGASASWNTSNPCSLAPGPPLASPWAEVNSTCAGLGATQDEQLITPEIFIECCDQMTLQFSNQFAWNAAGQHEIADVDVSTDGGASWTNVLRLENHDDGFPAANTRTVDLTPQVDGRDMQIRFHYYDGGGDGWWLVDNVDVSCSCSKTFIDLPSAP